MGNFPETWVPYFLTAILQELGLSTSLTRTGSPKLGPLVGIYLGKKCTFMDIKKQWGGGGGKGSGDSADSPKDLWPPSGGP